ncbi:MAG: peptidoglycan-binding protein [Chitinispirillaceae bacterium]|nr:peptidoglycan-binding protein [Chitinispirillaceae bacterium]
MVRLVPILLITLSILLCNRYEAAHRVQTNYDYYLALVQKNKEIQKKLRSKGYYKGKIDGVLGRRTVIAIKRLQKDRGIEETGILDKKTERALND